MAYSRWQAKKRRAAIMSTPPADTATAVVNATIDAILEIGRAYLRHCSSDSSAGSALDEAAAEAPLTQLANYVRARPLPALYLLIAVMLVGLALDLIPAAGGVDAERSAAAEPARVPSAPPAEAPALALLRFLSRR